MRTITHTVAGDTCHIHVPESRADVSGFRAFLAQSDKVLAVDTETTGLGIFESGFQIRLVQIGNSNEAWVLSVDLFADVIRDALRQDRRFVFHNAPFDMQVIDRHLGVTIEELASRTFDTRILAHLIDPREQAEGGIGLSLKQLAMVHVDDTAPDTQTGLHAEFRKLGLVKDTGWAGIPIDNELYLRYAGLDVILTHRLFRELAPIVKDLGLAELSKFEHHLSALLTIMSRKGMKVDVPYTKALRDRLLEEAETYRKVAARYGVENVNSTAQVAAALEAMGEDLTETTPSGALKVDKGVLLPLADMTNYWERIEAREPNPLANAVLRSKRADKWRESYATAFIDLRDNNDRIHAFLGGLQARTARMSVSRPPLQQLPSTDWTIRRAIVAERGSVFVAADLDQVELRVLAALADVKGMKTAITEGKDLHGYTAELVYGPGFTPKDRKLMKGVGFGKVYGGGAPTLARQTGAPLEDVKRAVADYDRVYPEVKRYSRNLQRQADFGKREVVTVSGRHLPLDRDRGYAALNYVVQSTSRDLVAQAIVDLFDAGVGEYLCLAIHDELLAEVPEAEAAEVAKVLGDAMSSNFYGVPITATGEVVGRNWGAAYGADPEEGWE